MEVIPDNFLYATLLESFDFPDSVKIIGGYAFDGCSQLKKSNLATMWKESGNVLFGGVH